VAQRRARHLLALVLTSSVRSSLARSLAAFARLRRRMAAVDVSRVVALASKAVTLTRRGHWASAAEKFAEAAAAAQALQQPDCVIVALSQASHADALLGHAQTAGVPEARRVELTRSAFLDLLPAAMASLQRRLAAGTLLAGACRPHEVAYCAAVIAHAKTPNTSNAASRRRVVPTAEAVTAYVGYDAYISTARIALEFCALATDPHFARTLNVSEATVAACSVFVESAFDMFELRMGSASIREAGLVRNAQIFLDEEKRFLPTSSNEWQARILAAWRRLQSSGVLQRRGILQGISVAEAYYTHATATAAATAAARGLHFCALHTCGAQEVHASLFKRCSACLSVVYCCKEHQVQGWPAHKAACRAARKAAEQPADEASGA
jgi:hypothetical protein